MGVVEEVHLMDVEVQEVLIVMDVEEVQEDHLVMDVEEVQEVMDVKINK